MNTRTHRDYFSENINMHQLPLLQCRARIYADSLTTLLLHNYFNNGKIVVVKFYRDTRTHAHTHTHTHTHTHKRTHTHAYTKLTFSFLLPLLLELRQALVCLSEVASVCFQKIGLPDVDAASYCGLQSVKFDSIT